MVGVNKVAVVAAVGNKVAGADLAVGNMLVEEPVVAVE